MTGHFEAKKHAYRQTQDGIVVSFVIHPNDVEAKFATAALGTRYMIGFAEIGDDGKPVPAPVNTAPATPALTKDRHPFASLPLSQQAAIRTDDKAFQDFLEIQTPIHHEESYADAVRAICGVQSRADIKPGTPAGMAWIALESSFQAYLTDQKYAGVTR